MTLPLALNSEPWKILTLVMDSIDFPSIGLMTLNKQRHKTTRRLIKQKDTEDLETSKCKADVKAGGGERRLVRTPDTF